MLALIVSRFPNWPWKCSRSGGIRHVVMRGFWGWAAVGLVWTSSLCFAERINQEGRILGPAPVVTNSTLFNTAQANAIVSAMQIFPVTSAWNEDISHRPVLVNSDAMIAQISADLSSTRRTLRAFQEMNFVLIPDSQPLVGINFVDYPDESDPSPYPIPPNMPIETWPTGTGGLTLQQRSEEHTSELQSPVHIVCRLLLEKKKKNVNSILMKKKKKKTKKKERTNKEHNI